MPEGQAGIFEADVGLNLITLGRHEIALILQELVGSRRTYAKLYPDVSQALLGIGSGLGSGFDLFRVRPKVGEARFDLQSGLIERLLILKAILFQ